MTRSISYIRAVTVSCICCTFLSYNVFWRDLSGRYLLVLYEGTQNCILTGVSLYQVLYYLCLCIFIERYEHPGCCISVPTCLYYW